MKVSHISQKSRRASRGFTLLEMVIVMGIIGLILGGAIGLMRKIGSGAEIQRVVGDFSAIRSNLDVFKINNGHYPTTGQGLQALVTRPSTPPLAKRWTQLMDELPKDPWGQDYKYRREGRKEPGQPEIYSMGPDKQENTADDLSDQD